MKRKELVQYVCNTAGLTAKDGQKVVDVVLAGIQKGFQEDGEVVLRMFGTFSVINRPPRKVVFSISGGGERRIEARKAVRFRASQGTW